MRVGYSNKSCCQSDWGKAAQFLASDDKRCTLGAWALGYRTEVMNAGGCSR